jgi:hypothetical protein
VTAAGPQYVAVTPPSGITASSSGSVSVTTPGGTSTATSSCAGCPAAYSLDSQTVLAWTAGEPWLINPNNGSLGDVISGAPIPVRLGFGEVAGVWVNSWSNGQPAISFANNTAYQSAGTSAAQPWAACVVFDITASNGPLLIDSVPVGGSYSQIGFATSTNALYLYGSAELSSTLEPANGAAHSLQAYFAGSSSSLRLDDGTAQTGSIGTATASLVVVGGAAGVGASNQFDLSGHVAGFYFDVSPSSESTFSSRCRAIAHTTWGTP